MSITQKAVRSGLRYHKQAYHFVFAALRLVQQKLGKAPPRREADPHAGGKYGTGSDDSDDEADEIDGHISGRELLDGIRELATQQFGLMTTTVFRSWGIQSTDDFGRIVFEMIERGEMRKTDRDRPSDFSDVYDFEDVFDRDYQIDTRGAFRRPKAK